MQVYADLKNITKGAKQRPDKRGKKMKRLTGLSRRANIAEKDFAEMRDAGIDCIEVSPAEEEYDTVLDFAKLKELSDKYGVALRSFHHRFGDEFDISSCDENVRKGAVAYYSKFIKEAAEVGIMINIVHASFEEIFASERADRMAAAKKSLVELAEYADTFGSTIAVEDLPRTCLGNCSAEILELISADARLRICFDTNHLLGEKIPDFINACKGKIVATHFSDYDFINERHWLPGEGDINWHELMDTLDGIGYTDPVLYEMNFESTWTIFRETPLTPFDFKRNHVELEGRLDLTRRGERKLKIGMWQ